ncbi:RNA polymerase Rpb4 family protein [Candidatus Micrarchaeota archaeon]|nr:RNA polymerase Rpb4 family protein [Candidatus Micrarchaeota archaeon]
MEQLNEKYITLSEAKDLLEKRKKDSELSYEQQNALDYLEKFAKLSKTESEKMKKELEGLGILTDKQIVYLINIVPQKEDTVKAILSQEKLELNGEQVKTVLKVCKKYVK